MYELVTVIPAAGESRRFKAAGYYEPKPLLLIKDRMKTAPMVQHVLDEAPDGKRVVGIPEVFFKSRSQFDGAECYPISSSTGQADSIYQLLRLASAGGRISSARGIRPQSSIVVMDCDMIVPYYEVKQIVRMLDFYDAVIAVTKTFDPNASRVDNIPFPSKFVEKENISEWGIVGVRAFRRADLLLEALEFTIHQCKKQGREPYLSMALNHYPGKKFAHIITEYKDWGTPERLRETGAEIVPNPLGQEHRS